MPTAGAETSTRSVQNTLLTLGGVLLGVTAIVFAGLAFTTAESGGRAVILIATTTVALVLPVWLARRTLTATAETVAAFGLLLVLLDGYVARASGLGSLATVPWPAYAAVLCALTAGVAAAYRLATRLATPQFATLILVQPVLPLIALQLGAGRTGFAATFAVVALGDLGAVLLLNRDSAAIGPGDPAPGPEGVAAPARGHRSPSGYTDRSWTARQLSPRLWPRLLREAAWVLFGLSLATAVIFAGIELALASTVETAARAAGALALAAVAGFAAGQLVGRAVLRHAAMGGATLAVIAAISKVDALAWPDHTLVLTAALAAGTALVASVLPAAVATGPRWAAIATAAVTLVGSCWARWRPRSRPSVPRSRRRPGRPTSPSTPPG